MNLIRNGEEYHDLSLIIYDYKKMSYCKFELVREIDSGHVQSIKNQFGTIKQMWCLFIDYPRSQSLSLIKIKYTN